ncbi:MAG: hypothetical protein OXH19_13275 [Chloroflexi bacterium]|nr:hypothetical protein [Chloroflexota bacterium]MDE2709022.1 hypothetical protein [Chloroflexota bacterium]
MTQTTQCGFCRETYEAGEQTYTPDALAAPLNQCAACARQEARGAREREYPMFDPPTTDRAAVERQVLAESTAPDGRYVEHWRPDDRVELLDWQPDDRVWLVSDA